MNRKKKICRLSFILCICMLCGSEAQAGAIQNKIDSAGEKISRLEDAVERTDGDISVYEREQQELEQEIANAQEKVICLSAELDETKAAAEDTKAAVFRTQKALEQWRAERKKQYEQMKRRIQFMYENSTEDMIQYVLEAGSMPEALRRASYFQAVISYDREKMNEYKATILRIKKANEELAAQKDELEALQEKQLDKLSEINGTLDEMKVRLNSRLSKIQETKALRLRYKQELENQRKYEQELERQKAEEDRRRAEEIKRQEEELRRQRQEQQRQKQQNSSTGTGDGSSRNDAGGVVSDSGSLELLSTIIYCEAGNQPYEGQIAVGSVVMNRVASRNFPNSISGVIYQKGQFSPVTSGRFARALAAGSGRRCRTAAQEVLNGRRNVSCLYFCVDSGVIDGTVIGDHVFY